MSKNRTTRWDRLARSLGYVPKAELDAEIERVEKLSNLVTECNDGWRATHEALRSRTELLRVNTRRLFEKGVEFGTPRDCPTCWDQALNDNKGGMRNSCVCGPLLPQCAYQVCVRGLQITEHKIE